MSQLNFNDQEGQEPRLVEGNDPLRRFKLKVEDDAGVQTAVDLTGAVVEIYIKVDNRKTDADTSTKKLSSADSSPRVTIPSPATQGFVDIQFKSTDFSQSPKTMWYHLDVIKSSNRETYAYGTIEFANV